MKAAFFLGAGLLMATPALATPGWDQPQVSALPQSELSYGAIMPPSADQRRQTLAAARQPAPNGPANVVPNSQPTANPPASGASSSATLAEHGEVATGAAGNRAGVSR